MGTGTDKYRPITIEASGVDVPTLFLEIFDTDQATTDTLVDSVTAP